MSLETDIFARESDVHIDCLKAAIEITNSFAGSGRSGWEEIPSVLENVYNKLKTLSEAAKVSNQ